MTEVGFSKEWNQRYTEKTHMSVWPWSDLVSYVMRYTNHDVNEFKVLELGCGAGANIPFFLSIGSIYHGIDGSEEIIQNLKEKFSQIESKLKVGDFTKEITFNETFDLIIDRGSLTCNNIQSIKNCLKLIFDKLNDKGRFIGIDLYSVKDSEFANGQEAEDKFTRTNFSDGPFMNTGRVHFFDKNSILELFSDFKIIKLEHKEHTSEIPHDDHNFASWNIVAEKQIS